MVDFQERDTRRDLHENGQDAGEGVTDGEAEIDEVRQQLEERPDGGSDADGASGASPERPASDGGTESGAGTDDSGRGHDDHGGADDHDHGEGDDHDHGEGDGHHHGEGDGHDHDHHRHDVETLGVAVVTVSSTRTLADDPSGDHIVEALVEADHDVVTRELIPDDYDDVQHTVDTLVRRGDVDAVVSTGGTGVTPDDCTVEAVRPLFEKELPGFGELFRRRSEAQIGTRVVATRATAGIADGVPVFCLPGSRAAVELGVEEIVVEEAPHLAGLASRETDEGADADEEHGAPTGGEASTGGTPDEAPNDDEAESTPGADHRSDGAGRSAFEDGD